MILVTGPLFAGKKDYIMQAMGLTKEQFAECAVWDVQQLAAEAPSLPDLADKLALKQIVVMTEEGSGVVPIDQEQRSRREVAGRLACLLARRATAVIRVYCGLPQLLKGELPC